MVARQKLIDASAYRARCQTDVSHVAKMFAVFGAVQAVRCDKLKAWIQFESVEAAQRSRAWDGVPCGAVTLSVEPSRTAIFSSGHARMPTMPTMPSGDTSATSSHTHPSPAPPAAGPPAEAATSVGAAPPTDAAGGTSLLVSCIDSVLNDALVTAFFAARSDASVTSARFFDDTAGERSCVLRMDSAQGAQRALALDGAKLGLRNLAVRYATPAEAALAGAEERRRPREGGEEEPTAKRVQS